MKKLTLILLFILLICYSAYAATDTRAVTVTVPAIFSLELTGADTSVDFGSNDPGTPNPPFDKPNGIFEATCKSNNGNIWYLKISNTQPFTLATDASVTISNNNFKWYGVYTDGTGTLVKTSQSMSASAATVYTASATEKVNTPNGTKIQLKFGLVIPTNVQAGTYNSTIVLTITE